MGSSVGPRRVRKVGSYSPAEADALKRRYEAGETLPQLMDGFEGSYRTLRAVLTVAGTTFRTPVSTSPLPRGMAEMYSVDGRSLRDTAAQFGVSLTTAKRMFDNAGVPLRPRGRPRKPETTVHTGHSAPPENPRPADNDT